MRFICGIRFLIVAVHFKSKQSNLMGWGVIIFQKILFQIPLVLQVTSFSFRMYSWQSLWLTPRHKCTFLGKRFASSNADLHQDLWLGGGGLFGFCFYLQKEYLFKCCIKSLWPNSGQKWWIWPPQFYIFTSLWTVPPVYPTGMRLNMSRTYQIQQQSTRK